MSLDERIIDLATRLAREYAEVREKVSEERGRLDAELVSERSRLEEQLRQRKLCLEREQATLARERARVRVVTPEVDDEVLTVNVGGQLFSTRRSTLCVYEGSYLANLFSGRWEGSIERDSNGHYFLDFDPVSFRLVLNFLRNRRLEGPAAATPPPCVPHDRKEHFHNLVEYLGLLEPLQEAQTSSSVGNVGSGLDGSVTGVDMETSANASSSLFRSAGSFLGGLVSGVANRDPIVSSVPAASASGIRSLPVSAVPGVRVQGHSGYSRTASVANSVAVATASAAATTDTSHGSTPQPPGWSRKVAHKLASIGAEDRQTVHIGDSRKTGSAAAVRATRGLLSNKHTWQVRVEICSDWSYVGFVSESWAAVSHPIGRFPQSWGVASNGVAFACREQVGSTKEFGVGSVISFVVDMEERVATVIIDGHEFPAVFCRFPAPIFPAVSNCRSPAEYAISFATDVPVAFGPH
eukprot:TRINITY_DN25096_c0_g1_i1.p1 TRINITY_DN25096_c0_g1~~TRINITY_DN25096_c0_g1_i1.p1  ORF type:complete len:466 (+),score=56.56 TRINITY_DN25096_c0_g1_i1:122-1519(+)